MTRTALARGLAAICFFAGAIPASSQSRPPAPPKRGPDVLLQLSIAAATTGLAEPYKGVTSNGSVEPGLFPIASTGVSTEPVRLAADRFLASLSPEPGYGFITLVPHPEDGEPQELIVPLGAIRQLRLSRVEAESPFGFALPSG